MLVIDTRDYVFFFSSQFMQIIPSLRTSSSLELYYYVLFLLAIAETGESKWQLNEFVDFYYINLLAWFYLSYRCGSWLVVMDVSVGAVLNIWPPINNLLLLL